MSTKTATFIKDTKNSQGVYQKLYKLSEPLDGHHHVIVRAAKHGTGFMHIHETCIFGANATGEITHWGELDGSYRNGTDHERALNNAGYTVTEAPSD